MSGANATSCYIVQQTKPRPIATGTVWVSVIVSSCQVLSFDGASARKKISAHRASGPWTFYDVSILNGPVGSNEVELDAFLHCPGVQCFPNELISAGVVIDSGLLDRLIDGKPRLWRPSCAVCDQRQALNWSSILNARKRCPSCARSRFYPSAGRSLSSLRRVLALSVLPQSALLYGMSSRHLRSFFFDLRQGLLSLNVAS